MFKSSWFAARRLQNQLLIWTALILVAAVIITGEIRTRSNILLLEDNLKERTETLMLAVERSLRPDSSIEDLQRHLTELAEADRTLERLDIVKITDTGLEIVATSSSTGEPVVASIPAALTTEIVHDEHGERAMVSTMPFQGTNLGLVAVSALFNIDRYEEFNRALTPAFGGILFFITIVLMYFMYQRTISRRFDELLDGIHRAKEGQIADIPADRQDEIGLIAKTLNSLLAQVRSFNDELQLKVSHATEDLNKRNLALEETTRQMVAMQQQLLQSERLATVGQMAATFAHEIGSPMSSLSAHVQLILEDPRLKEDQRETLQMIREQIQAVVQIVNDLLRSARRGPSDFVLTDINDILRTVIRLVEPKLTSQKVNVRVDLSPVPFVRGYPLYLQEAFLNVINNASEAMPDGGRLEVKSWFDEAAGRVNIRILDTGPGIDPSLVEHMFDHFVTTKAIGQGSGLGLGIVKEIVDSHRGSFRVGANNGRGTAAHITFPVETSAVLAS